LTKLSIIKVSSPRVIDRSPSDTLVTDEPQNKILWPSTVSEEGHPGLRRRKNFKGYCIYSDEDRSGESECCLSEDETEDTKACNPWEPPISMSSDEPMTLHQDTLEIRTYIDAPSTVSIIFPPLLPLTYAADNDSIASGTSFTSTTFDTLTYHRELREARVDSDFDQILVRLISEWYYTGASVSVIFRSRFETPVLTLRPSSSPSPRKSPPCVSLRSPSDLIVLHSVDTTVFGFSTGNLFNVDSFAKRSLIISSVAAAIGLFLDVWFIFAYSCADVRKFRVSPPALLIRICKPYNSDDLLYGRAQRLARDVFGTYFFFALSSRLPLVALVVAVLALVGFLCAIAWTAWPAAVLVMCVFTGVLVSLQFIVYGFHRLAQGFAWILRGAWSGAVYLGSRVRAVFRRRPNQATARVGLQGSPAVAARVIAEPVSIYAIPSQAGHTA
jgi:hypothetical protein